MEHPGYPRARSSSCFFSAWLPIAACLEALEALESRGYRLLTSGFCFFHRWSFQVICGGTPKGKAPVFCSSRESPARVEEPEFDEQLLLPCDANSAHPINFRRCRGLFLPPFVRQLATPSTRNASLQGGGSFFHQRWQKDLLAPLMELEALKPPKRPHVGVIF